MDYGQWTFHDVDYIYIQLEEKLITAILNNELSFGERIPPKGQSAVVYYNISAAFYNCAYLLLIL